MIRYQLVCDQGHGFEGWFRDSAAFDDQAGRRLLTCAACGSTAITKALMAPQVVSSREKRAKPRPQPQPQRHASHVPPEMLEMMRKLRDHIRESSENVGDRFPEEARRIHYDESEARSIHGEASLEEAKALLEEGIEIHPLPVLPEDKN